MNYDGSVDYVRLKILGEDTYKTTPRYMNAAMKLTPEMRANGTLVLGYFLTCHITSRYWRARTNRDIMRIQA
jgi:hypothetical protein